MCGPPGWSRRRSPAAPAWRSRCWTRSGSLWVRHAPGRWRRIAHHCPGEPIRIELKDDSGRFEVTVSDQAPSDEIKQEQPLDLGMLSDSFMSGFGIAVIAGLADDVEVFPSPKGMRIRMSWPAAQRPPDAAAFQRLVKADGRR